MIENWLTISETHHRELRHEAQKDHLARQVLAQKSTSRPLRNPLLILLTSLVRN